MARRLRIFDPKAAYHVFGRGVRKQEIFLCPEDCDYFVDRIAEYLLLFTVRIITFCLMPNHYHLEVIDSGSSISAFMHRLLGAYVNYFNRRYAKTGHLFERRFNAKACRNDRYAFALARYIDLNPVRSRLVEHPGEWPWSGWKEKFAGSRRPIISLPDWRNLLGNPAEYREFVEEARRRTARSEEELKKLPAMLRFHQEIPNSPESFLEKLARQRTAQDEISIENLRTGGTRQNQKSRKAFILDAREQAISLSTIARFLGRPKSTIQSYGGQAPVRNDLKVGWGKGPMHFGGEAGKIGEVP